MYIYNIQNLLQSNDKVVKPSFSMVVGSDLLVNDLKISIFLVFTIGNTVLHCDPAGSKCEALRLGVHLILLYFIRILLLTPKIIFLFRCGCGCGCGCGQGDNAILYCL